MRKEGKAEGACILLVAWLCLLMFSGAARAQCAGDSSGTRPDAAQIQQAFEQHHWAEVVRLAGPLPSRSADLNFDYGLALAHLQRWSEAHAALLHGERQCPRQKRFDLELAGIAFELKRYPEAAKRLHRALKIDPKDEYANNFAGTVYLLMGNVNAALKYWNRVGKPYAATLNFDPHLRVHRLILDRAIAFSPAAVLKESEFETTEARVNGLGIFPIFNVALNARADGTFDAEFHAQEEDGFGSSRLQALVAIFGGAPYETIYPSYFDIGKSAMNIESLLRWDTQKRRAWVSISAPLHDLPQYRWKLGVDARNENWAIRRSFTGTAPVLGSLNLELEKVSGAVTGFPSGRLQWSTGAELSHRSYRNVVDGTALTPSLVVPGYELKYLASIEGKVIDVPERRLWLTLGANSELARMWNTETQVPGGPQLQGAPQLFDKLQGAVRAHWFPQAQGDRYEAAEQVRAGRTFGSAPFDELFLLGVERDTDLWLRGQIGTRDGKKGSSPLGSSYFLANTDFYRRLYGNGLFSIKAGPLADIGRATAPGNAPANGLSTGQWLFDVGAEAQLTVLGTSIKLTYGRDLRMGTHAFYGTIAGTMGQ